MPKFIETTKGDDLNMDLIASAKPTMEDSCSLFRLYDRDGKYLGAVFEATWRARQRVNYVPAGPDWWALTVYDDIEGETPTEDDLIWYPVLAWRFDSEGQGMPLVAGEGSNIIGELDDVAWALYHGQQCKCPKAVFAYPYCGEVDISSWFADIRQKRKPISAAAE